MDAATVLTLSSPQGAATSGPEERTGAAPIDSIDPTVNERLDRSRNQRTGFDSTMGGVGAGQVNPSMPIWAQRSNPVTDAEVVGFRPIRLSGRRSVPLKRSPDPEHALIVGGHERHAGLQAAAHATGGAALKAE